MKRLPVGIEDFKELIDKDYYLVDKTELILETIPDKVALYTRPRRFGKTLNISMLKYFYDIKQKDNAYLFNDLKIQSYPEALVHQNQYPVISISLKDMQYNNIEEQKEELRILLHYALDRYRNDIINSNILTNEEKEIFLNIIKEKQGIRLPSSIRDASQVLYKHYGKKVIILIDEYDVPLQWAYRKGFYEEMVDFIRNLFSSAFKTNEALEKGIMTGCLRIAKESIFFSGLNNFRVHSIFDHAGSDCFGFTIEETKKLLEDYGMLESYDSIQEWYDGYLFGKTEIYNPWSLVLSVDDRYDNKPHLVSYWANTSSNALVYDYIKQGDEKMRQDFETLVQGKSITKTITPELTYRDMDQVDNVYSFLLFTGYLKIQEQIDRTTYKLVIPNKEVKYIFEDIYMRYFGEMRRDYSKQLLTYLKEEKVNEANLLLREILISSVSFYDNYETFYHGFMLGLFSGYSPTSNREAGEGRYDLGILTEDPFGTSVLFEFKYSKNSRDLKTDSEKAVEQIKEKHYIEELEAQGYYNIKAYGISFYGKYCYLTKL